MKNLLLMTCLTLATCSAPICAQVTGPSLAEAVASYENMPPAPLLDRNNIVASAKLASVLLSPDGGYVAYLANEGHSTALYVYDVRTARKTRLFASPELATIHWMSDGRNLLLNLGDTIGIVAIDQPDKPAYIARLDTVRDEQLLGARQGVLDHIFIAGHDQDGSYVLEQVDLDGTRRELLRQESMIRSAVTAADGDTVIVELATSRGTEISLLQQGTASVVFSCALLETCHLVAYQATTDSLWLTANVGSNLIGLAEYSLAERELFSRHNHAAGIVDQSTVVLSRQQPVAVQYQDGLLQNYGLDAGTELRVNEVQALLPLSGFTPQVSDDGNTRLIRESSAVLQYPRFHLFDVATGTLTEILQEERESTGVITPSALSEQIPFQYPAQDGSIIHGYVSLPKGTAISSAPMVTLVHGGPIGRIVSGYSDFTQFLVNRGYIVFEPNFRASTGYGRRYVEQSAGEFGDGLVQQDIIDGVKYLTAQGIGDPDQLGIAGHSFGGGAVLGALAFTPDLFKAGFASAPPADMVPVMRFQNAPERNANQDPSTRALGKLMLGSIEDTAAMLAMSANSAQARLSQISAPLLLIAGGDDRQVPISHVKEYTLQLLNQQKTLSFFLDEDEGHGIGQAEGRSKLAYFWMAEEFFAIYLGGRKQALDDAALGRYIARKMLINNNPQFSVQGGN